MAVNPISSSILNILSESAVTNKTVASDGASFSDILSEALNTVAETDRADKGSAVELLTGETDDMSGLLLDAEKAEIALQLTLQVRNKVIDAYNEIMRMSV